MTAATTPGHYSFRHAARMEWVKLRSLRSTWWTLAVTIAAAAGIAVAVGVNTEDVPFARGALSVSPWVSGDNPDRVDLRFGMDENGELYLLTKQDAGIRALRPAARRP